MADYGLRVLGYGGREAKTPLMTAIRHAGA
jgi:hypothetical protein